MLPRMSNHQSTQLGFIFRPDAHLDLPLAYPENGAPWQAPRCSLLNELISYNHRCGHKMTLVRQQQGSVSLQQIVVDWWAPYWTLGFVGDRDDSLGHSGFQCLGNSKQKL